MSTLLIVGIFVYVFRVNDESWEMIITSLLGALIFSIICAKATNPSRH